MSDGDLQMITERAGEGAEPPRRQAAADHGRRWLPRLLLRSSRSPLERWRAQSGTDRVTVYDNYVRGVPSWLADLEGRADLTIVKHDVRTPLPEDIDDFEYVVHAAGIASPTYYRHSPHRDDGCRMSTGCGTLLEYCAPPG